MKNKLISIICLLLSYSLLHAEEFLVYHVTADLEVAKAKFKKIDFNHVNAENNRFGRAFYVAADLETVKQEIIQNGGIPKAYIIYKVNSNKPMMDLTKAKIRKSWDYENLAGKAGHKPLLGVMARGFGFLAIKFESTKNAGGINYAIFEESIKSLKPVELVEIND